jgi:hypothetical protein
MHEFLGVVLTAPKIAKGAIIQLEPHTPTIKGITFGQGLHQAAALAVFTLLLTVHRAVANRGFILRREGFSTDVLLVAALGALTTMWSLVVAMSNTLSGGRTCTTGGYGECLARLAYIPWLLQIFFFFWLIGFVDAIRLEDRRRTSTVPCGLWNLSSGMGPYDWTGSINKWYRLSLYIISLLVIASTSYGSFQHGYHITGFLNLIGIALFYTASSGLNPYASAPHKYAGDMIRVALATSHSAGTVYVLPSRGYAFDAVWSPKIEAEHIQTDEYLMPLFFRLRSGDANVQTIEATLRLILAPFSRRTILTVEQLNDLADWLYADSNYHGMRGIRCKRQPNTNLIGRDVLYALCHAEYLLFVNRDMLSPERQALFTKFRNGARSGGTNGMKKFDSAGFQAGLDGYRWAVREVYAIFGENIVDPHALDPFIGDLQPPSDSKALRGVKCADMEEYVTRLWNLCILDGETTFTALYAFSCIWFAEMGNVGGFHIFPLQSRTKQGDLVIWHIVWRQAWFCCITAQLVTMSPVILSAFIAGLLN